MVNLICIGLYFLFMIIWLMLLLVGSKRYAYMIEPLDKKQYPLKALFPAGFELLQLTRRSFRSAKDLRRIGDAQIIYGEREGEFYYRVLTAEKYTYVSFFMALSPILGPLLGSPALCVVGLFAAGISWYAVDSRLSDVIKQREFEIARDFSDMVSKMALLINAGMITREAWENISYTGEGTLYEEMKRAVLSMRNGVSEIDAYIDFGSRCGSTMVKKFVSMLAQNLAKGNKELVDFLKGETVVSWEEKKHLVRRQGEKANNRMMLPLGMILIGIFVMILVPVVSNLGI